MPTDLSDIERSIGHQFARTDLLVEALTHPSSTGDGQSRGNGRLEFIGDAVIDLIVAHLLYDHHAARDEGWLSQTRSSLVDEDSLASKARDLALGGYIVLGKGEEAAGGRDKQSILAGAYEALIGALFLDAGYEACRSIIARDFGEIADLTGEVPPGNYKSLLQERLQKEGKDLPRYEVIEVLGPDHERIFTVAVFVGDREWGRGSGRNKKDAEQAAARQALKI